MTEVGTLRLSPPIAWESRPNAECPAVPVSFRRLGPQRFGFEVTGRTDGHSLVIDPILEWSTLLGGSEVDEFKALAADAAGDWVTAGVVSSLDFPVTPGAFDLDLNGSFDVAISRISADGSALLSSTYLGGSGTDTGVTVAVHPSDGSLIAGGFCWSPDFPTTLGAVDGVHGDLTGVLGDGFVTRLTADGSQLIFSTLLGGPAQDLVDDLAVLPSGSIAVVGSASPGFPTLAGGYRENVLGNQDGFLLRLAADGTQIEAGTFFGGSGGDSLRTVAALPSGELWVAGPTTSIDLPVTAGALQVENGDRSEPIAPDVVVARFDSTLSQLLDATYFGGDGEETVFDSLATEGNRFVICGRTLSSSLPLPPNGFASGGNGSVDAFVAEFAPGVAAVPRGARLGGSDYEQAWCLSRTTDGIVTVGGTTLSPDFPITPQGAISSSLVGVSAFGGDVFITRLDAAMESILDSTFLGGTDGDHGIAMASSGDHAIVLAGLTFGTDYPTTAGGYSTAYGGGLTDSFLSRIAFAIPDFTRGEANGDGAVGIADAITVLTFLFLAGDLSCFAAADVDASGAIDLADPIGLIGYLFLGGPAPASPFPGCGAATGPFSCHRSLCP